MTCQVKPNLKKMRFSWSRFVMWPDVTVATSAVNLCLLINCRASEFSIKETHPGQAVKKLSFCDCLRRKSTIQNCCSRTRDIVFLFHAFILPYQKPGTITHIATWPPRGWRFGYVLQIAANTDSSRLTPAEVRSNLQRSTRSVTSLEAMYFWRYRKLYTTFDTFAAVLLKTLWYVILV